MPRSDIEVRTYTCESSAYQQELDLRFQVLRKPLGRKLTAEDRQKDSISLHVGLFENQKMCGCLILTPFSELATQMRQVAISPEKQSQGLGQVLVEAAEQLAAQHKFKEIFLHARESAIPFYERCGYKIEGSPFEEIRIPHVIMRKALKPILR